ncbi:MAG: tol-pal system protein YbgF [Comamonas sp.]|nr:tol-pal system protein YbgF [Comamonas sp.]
MNTPAPTQVAAWASSRPWAYWGRWGGRTALLCALGWGALPAHALFEDAEARRAILELRQHAEASTQENAQLRRSLLDLQGQIDSLRSELAQLQGQNEQLVRQTTQIAEGVDQRLSKFEPTEVQVDGLRFMAEPQERDDFEAALALFREGNYPAARKAFAAFVNGYPGSGYMPSARFWLANTQYAGGDYKEAVANFRAVVKAGPEHQRAADAALGLANSQLELKDRKGERQTLQALVKDYPDSPAAQEAKQRLK